MVKLVLVTNILSLIVGFISGLMTFPVLLVLGVVVVAVGLAKLKKFASPSADRFQEEVVIIDAPKPESSPFKTIPRSFSRGHCAHIPGIDD